MSSSPHQRYRRARACFLYSLNRESIHVKEYTHIVHIGIPIPISHSTVKNQHSRNSKLKSRRIIVFYSFCAWKVVVPLGKNCSSFLIIQLLNSCRSFTQKLSSFLIIQSSLVCRSSYTFNRVKYCFPFTTFSNSYYFLDKLDFADLYWPSKSLRKSEKIVCNFCGFPKLVPWIAMKRRRHELWDLEAQSSMYTRTPTFVFWKLREGGSRILRIPYQILFSSFLSNLLM